MRARAHAQLEHGSRHSVAWQEHVGGAEHEVGLEELGMGQELLCHVHIADWSTEHEANKRGWEQYEPAVPGLRA